MGRNLLLNMADHGFSVAVYDKDKSKVDALRQESGTGKVHGAESREEFIPLLRQPRVVIMLVPAGPIVDNVIRDVLHGKLRKFTDFSVTWPLNCRRRVKTETHNRQLRQCGLWSVVSGSGCALLLQRHRTSASPASISANLVAGRSASEWTRMMVMAHARLPW